MKKFVIFVIIIFSLFIVESSKYQCTEKNKDFLNIENIMLRDYMFVENGIKVEYSTKAPINNEKERIIEKLLKSSNLDIVQADGCIVAFDDNNSYNITLYENNETRVEIVIINNNNNVRINNLITEVNKLKSNNCIEERYFSFIKGKLKVKQQDISKEIFESLKTKDLQWLDIENGRTAKGKLKDGMAVNIGQISYNTGEYLIIGTPVIFTTY